MKSLEGIAQESPMRSTERRGSISWTPGFLTEDSRLAAMRAEEITGLDAREIWRPAHQSDCGEVVTPADGFTPLRCQLGRKEVVTINLPEIPNVRGAVRETVIYFRLIAFGSTWAEAVAEAGSRRR